MRSEPIPTVAEVDALHDQVNEASEALRKLGLLSELTPRPTLAALLPTLPEDIRRALIGADPTRWRPAIASALLLEERGRLVARVAEVNRKFDDVVAQAREAIEQLAVARRQLRVASAGVEDVWRWVGDGEDHPESMGCPVVMSAERLREFVAARARVAELEAERAVWRYLALPGIADATLEGIHAAKEGDE